MFRLPVQLDPKVGADYVHFFFYTFPSLKKSRDAQLETNMSRRKAHGQRRRSCQQESHQEDLMKDQQPRGKAAYATLQHFRHHPDHIQPGGLPTISYRVGSPSPEDRTTKQKDQCSFFGRITSLQNKNRGNRKAPVFQAMTHNVFVC